ncbi:hypothetical protein E9536_20385 [Burkholderia sp. LS-044]|uniref:hypothetical protein n=1 Tax=Burkholderia sp. LS-044 TaxID=1459967 RepID=UPI0010A6A7CE|nr:hypothetical protein [Burkholderia sp. LS-044]THJ52619.1 hypothetical protein E9536_20385 [Burkholderia sp. LS-044]
MSDRSCSTCSSYDDGECMNGIGNVTPNGVCNQHKTREEERKDGEALVRFRESIGLPPQMRYRD